MLVKSLRLSIIILLSLLGASASRAQTPVIGQPCPASGQSGITAQGTPVICTQVPGGGALVWTATSGTNGGSTVPGLGTAPNQSYWYLVPQSLGCGTLTNCTAIYGDGKVVTDVTSNSTTTITCPNNDCNFVAGDAGKAVWATTQGTGNSGTYLNTTYVCPITTISTVNSAQSITVGTACTASGTANVVLIWGHRDGATLHGIDGDTAGVGCRTIIPFSQANILIDQATFITAPACSSVGLQTVTGYPQRDWIPTGNNVNLIITPDFNYATCTGSSGAESGVCIGVGLNEFDNTGIWGSGLTPGANANCSNASGKTILALSSTNAGMINTNVSGVCPGETGVGVQLLALDEHWKGGGAQYAMSKPCDFLGSTGSTLYTNTLDCRMDAVSPYYGAYVENGASVTDISTFPIVGLHVLSGGLFQSRGTHYTGIPSQVGAITVDSGGTFYSYGDYIGVDNCAANVVGLNVNGQVQSANTQYCAGTGGAAIQFGTGTFISLGGNKITGGALNYFTGNAETGMDVLQGACSGTVTSATTIGLYRLGNDTTTTCTSTTTNQGQVMGKAGTVYSFGCYAGTAGNQSADACTVVKSHQGTPTVTSMTCSLNGATFCGDGATGHQFTYAQGDVISVEVISGTSTTLANVSASVLAW